MNALHVATAVPCCIATDPSSSHQSDPILTSDRIAHPLVYSPVGVDTSQQLRLELHVVEVVDYSLPVGLDVTIGDLEVIVTSGRGGWLLFRPEGKKRASVGQ